MSARRKPSVPVNKSGQVLGQKGHGTRLRIIAATEELIAGAVGLEPSVAAIARTAGISPASFYVYFADVGEAVLAVVSQLEGRMNPLVTMLDEPWPREAHFTKARDFVAAYFDFWLANASNLQVRNRLAEQGDARFIRIRLTTSEALTKALTRKIADMPFADGLACTPRSAASVLVTAMERLATVEALKLYPKMDNNLDATICALANLIAITVRGG